MPTRNISFAEGEFYHIFNRGNSKQKIYLSSADYNRFLMLLYLSNTPQQFNIRDLLKNNVDIFTIERSGVLVRIGAYCLMPNHFHLILSPLVEGGISKFLLKLCTAYTMYFNTKYDRTGRLYENSYKAKYIDSDEYLKYLFSYIHLNPVTKKTDEKRFSSYPMQSYTEAINYPYSSLKDYLQLENSNSNPNLTNPRVTLGFVDTSVYGMYFNDDKDVKNELFDWLKFEEPALG